MYTFWLAISTYYSYMYDQVILMKISDVRIHWSRYIHIGAGYIASYWVSVPDDLKYCCSISAHLCALCMTM